MIRIKVPATTANIGPGYDVLGAALSLYACFDAELSDSLYIEGCPEEYRNEDNLFIRSYKKALEMSGRAYIPISLKEETEVPIARGLGSSSTCIVGGIMAANELHGLGLSKEDMVSLATSIEGHPDNVAPAIYGGVVAGFSEGGRVYCTGYSCDGDWRFVTLIPDYEVRTEDARRVVKKDIGLADSIYTTGHVTGLLRALETGDEELLSAACRDILHEPYRRELIPDYEKARELAVSGGAAAFFISGSGSTMMAAVKQGDSEQRILEEFKQAFPGHRTLSLSICSEGAERMETR